MSEETTLQEMSDLDDTFSVKNALVAMINDYALKAVEYKTKLDEAQTAVKRDFYAKKLRANNEEAADSIVALENLLAEEKKTDEPSNEESVDAAETA